jgi:hypothetical protein
VSNIPTSSAQPEPILGIIPNAQRRKGVFNVTAETYMIVVTPVRLIFLLVTQPMMKEASAQAAQQAKQEGKGVLGRIAAQLNWQNVLCERYMTQMPEALLHQQPGNFAIPCAQLTKVKFEHDHGGEDSAPSDFLVLESPAGKHKFELKSGNPKDFKQLLQQAVGALVR